MLSIASPQPFLYNTVIQQQKIDQSLRKVNIFKITVLNAHKNEASKSIVLARVFFTTKDCKVKILLDFCFQFKGLLCLGGGLIISLIWWTNTFQKACQLGNTFPVSSEAVQTDAEESLIWETASWIWDLSQHPSFLLEEQPRFQDNWLVCYLCVWYWFFTGDH